MLLMLKVARKGQAHKMPNTDFNGCPVGFMPAGQPITASEQQTLSAEPWLGSQGLLPFGDEVTPYLEV